ncbi:hypothetical protein PENSPDRAFT_653082 [Peniophora sp. CONT]|nr:hypothetical protein PENSPDRAFT_653082 [Peniophora sp. CONT]
MSTRLQYLTLILLCEDIADVESQKGLLGCLGELYGWLNCRHEEGRAPITINTTAHVAALLKQDSGVVERSWYYKPDKTTKLSDMVSQVNIITARDVRGN